MNILKKNTLFLAEEKDRQLLHRGQSGKKKKKREFDEKKFYLVGYKRKKKKRNTPMNHYRKRDNKKYRMKHRLILDSW